MKNRLKSLVCGSIAVAMLSQTLMISPAKAETSVPSSGNWMTGEYHTHTVQSSDASESFMTVENVLNGAFRENLEQLPPETVTSLNYGEPFDFLMLTDHLRNSPRDPEGKDKPTARWEAMRDQQAKLEQLQADGKYANKIIYPGFEWDMMGLDHASVAIVDSNSDAVPVEAIRQFEWLYSYDTTNDKFTSNEEELWGPRLTKDELKLNKDKTFEAIEWLQNNYPESFVLPNHPSRHNGSSTGVVTIEDLRRMHDIAPNIVFGMEGMPGGQMSPDGHRADMTDIYGGADVMIAQVGGIWDAMLGEGRRFWNFSNSDHHFKISSNRKYSSGYWPSEYSRNYTWVEGNSFKNVIDGMRSGKSFSVYGDLINALDFTVSENDKQAEMGEELQVDEGENTTISIRFKSPEYNNYAPIGNHATNVTNEVKVNHVDLISGEVTGKLDESEYGNDTNETTKVVKRFTEADWGQPDAEGYYTITHTVPADTDRYYRLRGTNLDENVEGYIQDGEPLQDQSFANVADNEERFNKLNDRNYTGLWFYSNPIFVDVTEKSDEQIIAETIQHITTQLGDTSAVTSSFSLPSEGLNSASIQWKSSDEHTLKIENNTAIITRPSAGIDAHITLTATVSRGNTSLDKEFTVIVKALPSDNSNNNGSSNGGSSNNGSSNNSSSDNSSSNGSSSSTSPSKPNVTVSGGGGTTRTDDKGNVSILPDSGYRIKEVKVNGVSKGTETVLTGLKSTDTVVVTFEKIPTEPEKPSVPVPSANFTDVGNHWAASAIDFVTEKGLFVGTSSTTFSPNNEMTRGMFISVLHRLAGKPAGNESVNFNDVATDAYYHDAVEWASSNNIVKGIGNNVFAPQQSITREQLALIFFNFAKTLNLDVSAKQSLSTFTNNNLVSPWAAEAMQWATGSKLMIGNGNNILNPKGTATRAEVASIVERMARSIAQ